MTRRDNLLRCCSHAALSVGAALALSASALALPTSPAVVAASPGQTGFSGSSTSLTVTTSSRRVVIDWGTFNISRGERVTFNLPDGTSIAVNRVSGNDRLGSGSFGNFSVIAGDLVSNGNVWLLNPSGVFFQNGARLDVGGLLATTARMTTSPETFVNAALAAPVAFAGTATDGPISIDQGAEIVVRGGPAMFIGAGGNTGRVFVRGSVTGGGTPEEQASSQVLYGSAGVFSLRLGQTPPNPLTSSDLQLFDFSVANSSFPAFPQSAPPDIGAITVETGSVTRAGQVIVSSHSGLYGFETEPGRVFIRGRLEATNPAGFYFRGSLVISDQIGQIVFGRRVPEQTGPDFGDPVVDPLIELVSAGGIDVFASRIYALKRTQVATQNGVVTLPDHATVSFSARGGTLLYSPNAVLEDAILNGANLQAGLFTLRNSFVDINAGRVTDASVTALEVARPDGERPGRPVNIRFGDITGYTVSSLVIVTNGAIALGDVTSGLIALQGGGSVSARSIVGNVISIQSQQSDIAIGTGEGATFVGGDVFATRSRLTLDARGGIRAGNLSAGDDADLFAATGAIAVGDITAQGTLTARALAGFSSGSIGVGSGVDISAEEVDAGNILAETADVLVSARRRARLGNVTAGGAIDLLVTDGALSARALSAVAELRARGYRGLDLTGAAGSAVTLEAAQGSLQVIADQGQGEEGGQGGQAGPVILATAGDVRINARDDITVGQTDAFGAVSMQSLEGRVDAAAVTAGGDLAVDAPIGVRVDAARGASVRLATNGRLDIGQTLAEGGFLAGTVEATQGDVTLFGRTGVRAGDVTAARDAEALALAGRVGLGDVEAGRDARLSARGGVLETGAVDAGGRAELAGDAGVNAASVRGADVDVSAIDGDVRIGTGGSVFTPGEITATAGNLRLAAAGSVTGGNLTAARALEARSARGDITLNDLAARTMAVNAEGGDILINAARGETLRLSALAGASGSGAVRVTGAVDLRPAGEGATGPNAASLAVRASDTIRFDAAVTAERDILLDAGGLVRIAGPITVRNAFGDQLATGEFGQAGRIFGGLDIRAGDLDLLSDVSVAGRTGVHIAARGPALRAGGDAGAGGLVLSADEINRIRAPLLALRAGLAPDANADLVLGTLALDRARIGALLLTAGSAGRVRVTGTLTGAGAPDVTIGETAQRPRRIAVTGALGTTAGRLGALRLISAGDILIGSEAFIDLVSAAADPLSIDVRNLAAGFGGVTPGQIFLAAGTAAFDAPGVILSQNTGGRTGGGLSFAAGEGPVFGALGAPARIDVFGAVTGANATQSSGRDAALAPGLLAAPLASSPAYRFNGCVIGTGAGCGSANVLGTVNGAATGLPARQGGAAAVPGAGAGQPDGPEDEDEETARERARAAARGLSVVGETQAGPIRVDPSARDLLDPGEERDTRDPGVSAANEDLWPGAPQ